VSSFFVATHLPPKHAPLFMILRGSMISPTFTDYSSSFGKSEIKRDTAGRKVDGLADEGLKWSGTCSDLLSNARMQLEESTIFEKRDQLSPAAFRDSSHASMGPCLR